MTRFRRTLVSLIALSLAIVPAGANAYAANMAALTASQASNCSPCPMTHVVEEATYVTSVSGDCHQMDGKGGPMTPSACAVFCSGLIALPMPTFFMSIVVATKPIDPCVEVTLAAHIDPPEPYPPKR